MGLAQHLSDYQEFQGGSILPRHNPLPWPHIPDEEVLRELPLAPPPKPRQTIKGGMAFKPKGAIEYLINTLKVAPELAKQFVAENKYVKGWRASKGALKIAYEEWLEGQPDVLEVDAKAITDKKEELAKRSEERAKNAKRKKDKKKDEEPIASPTKHIKRPAIRPTVEPAQRLRPFRLTAKTFDELKNTKPRLEFKRMIKDYFAELGITDYNKLSGDFVSAINNRPWPVAPTDKQLEELSSILNFHKMNLSKKGRAQPSTVELLQAPSEVKPKKTRKPRAKKVATEPKIKKAKVKALPKKDTVKKPRKPRAKKVKGKGEDTPSDKTIEKEIRLII